MLRKLALILSLIGLAPLVACLPPPSGLNSRWTGATAHDKCHVAVHSLTDPTAINKVHAWEIQLRSPSGEAVLGARISDGGMLQHGHGFPTQPGVTRELGDGRYLLEGMKFSMPGWWEIKLKIVRLSSEVPQAVRAAV